MKKSYDTIGIFEEKVDLYVLGLSLYLLLNSAFKNHDSSHFVQTIILWHDESFL